MSDANKTTRPSPLRSWLWVVGEIPEWRGDLTAKMEFFAAWRLCR
jgi:hypothetical protein